MKSLQVKLCYFSALFLLWLDGCQSLTDSSLPEIFFPFGTDEGDSVVREGYSTFAGPISIPYQIYNYRKLYVSSTATRKLIKANIRAGKILGFF